jgi:tRNA-splicing ligase RtcB (3'-phosphate/5'-hydroxy nucleic acid ligase)
MAEQDKLKIEIKKISEFEWEIPKTGKMLVPGKIFASEKLITDMKRDITFNQVRNVATLPGILKASIAMPDAHQGYGMEIGGVAAFDLEKGVISPGMTGFDINCGIRILVTDIKTEDFIKKKKEVLHSVYRSVPSGVGKGHKKKLDFKDIDEILVKGAEWAVENGYGKKEDLEKCEESGRMPGANPEDVSQRAKARGLPQLGTLGSGNHFLEFQNTDEIFDEKIAKVFGLKKGYITIMIHCGSRGLGHQVASDYMKLIEDKYGWPEEDRELSSAPINSELGKKYYSAMAGAVNFALCNRQMIMHYVQEQIKYYFPNAKTSLVYDVCHNISKLEEHNVDGKTKTVLVVRKGATRAFGPGRKELPKIYKETGQPIILPGSMGTSSYVLVGTKKAEEISFGSTAHGAGRVESRSQALRELRGEDVKKQLNDKGIDVEAGSWQGLAEEAPQVYKDIDEVVRVSHEAGIGKLVAKVIPIAVMKG